MSGRGVPRGGYPRFWIIFLPKGGSLAPPLEVRGGLRSENGCMLENDYPLNGSALFSKLRGLQTEAKTGPKPEEKHAPRPESILERSGRAPGAQKTSTEVSEEEGIPTPDSF